MPAEAKFYVYEHIRPDTGQVFYVGKGHSRRAWDWHRGRNRWHKAIVKKLRESGIDVEVRIFFNCLLEKTAFKMERIRISYWKSVGVNLCNLSEGGEGPSGLKHTDEWKADTSEKLKAFYASPEARAKKSEIAKKALADPDVRARLSTSIKKAWENPELKKQQSERSKGRRHTEESKKKISDAHTGRSPSEDSRKRMSAGQSARFSNPHQREATSIATRAACADPEVRARTSAAAKARMATPEGMARREKMSQEKMKPVVCVETGEIFSRASVAAEKFGCSEKTIYRVIASKKIIRSGFSFAYIESAK